MKLRTRIDWTPTLGRTEGSAAAMAPIPKLAEWGREQFVEQARAALSAGRLDLVHTYSLLGVSRFPDSAELLAVLGWAYARSSDSVNAESTFRHALSCDDSLADAHAGLAAVLATTRRFDEADPHYRRAQQLGLADSPTLFNHGSTLLSLGRLEEAVAAFERAVRLDPTSADALHNLGIAFGQLGRWDRALDACQRALALNPKSWQVRVLRAMSHVALGSFAAGWDDYEARLDAHDAYHRMLRLPRWQGRSDQRHSIIAIPEQGIGTQIMFASCMADLLEAVPACTLGCDPRLISLFRRSFPSVDVVAGGALPALAQLRDYDGCVMAGSLPRVFRRERADFPGTCYLAADPLARGRWRNRLAALGPGTKIGISWRGGTGAADARHRCTQPGDWQRVLRLPNVRWINLQYDADASELAAWSQVASRPFHTWRDLDQKHDLDSLAALLTELDSVITVVNSTVHLAGALGIPTWALIPAGGEWRWLDGGDACLWHESVRLVRQPRRGDWSDVFTRLEQQVDARHRLSNAAMTA